MNAQPAPPRANQPQASSSESASNVACGTKRTCSQMTSCEEAQFYLVQCGVKSLDRNSDGVPCEKLCR